MLDEVSDGTEFVIFGEGKLSVRAYLRRFLFADERIATKVKHLSGGERSRLLLARILKNGGNFLILDEPNQHDLDTCQNLARAGRSAGRSFPGVVLVVSHDRYFLNRVCADILAFEGDGRVAHSAGDYGYLPRKKRRDAQTSARESIALNRLENPAPLPRSRPPSPHSAASASKARELEGMEAAVPAWTPRSHESKPCSPRPFHHARSADRSIEPATTP